MKWDPTKEMIDDFAFKYKELGRSLGLNDENIFDYFKACIPAQYFVFVYSVNTMADAVANLKKCIAAGPMIPSGMVQTTGTTTMADDKPKFMAVQDTSGPEDIISQLKESLEEVVMEKVEDGLNETREMVDQMFQMMAITGTGNQGQNQYQGQGYNQLGGNNRFTPSRGRGGQNFQLHNGNQGRSSNFGNGFNQGNRDQQCSFCKRWMHSITNCQLLLVELRKCGFRIARNGGFSNGGRNGFNGFG